MDADLKNKLEVLGVDIDDAMARFSGSDRILVKFLKKLPTTDTYDKLKEAIAAGNAEDALMHSHTLKGNCGNLSLTKLYQLFSDQVALFRVPDYDAAVAMMPEIEEVYNYAVEKISEL